MGSYEFCQVGSLIYPIMLAQEAGEISEAKAAELLATDLVSYRETKSRAIHALLRMLEELPSPLNLLLGVTEGKQSSLTSKDE